MVEEVCCKVDHVTKKLLNCLTLGVFRIIAIRVSYLLQGNFCVVSSISWLSLDGVFHET